MGNNIHHNLARIPLRWMIRQCFLANTGIRFHTELFKNVGLDPAMLHPRVQAPPEPLLPTDIISDKEYEEYLATLAAEAVKSAAAASPALATKPPAAPAAPPMHARIDSAATMVDELLSAGPTPASTPRLSEPSKSLTVDVPVSTLPRKTTLKRLLEGKPGELTEAEEDLADLLSPLYDQLSLAPAWWILEVIPLEQRYQKPNNKWVSEPVSNWGQGRYIPVRTDEGKRVKVHRSVAVRMSAEIQIDWENGTTGPMVYVPNARYHRKILHDEEVKKEIDWVL